MDMDMDSRTHRYTCTSPRHWSTVDLAAVDWRDLDTRGFVWLKDVTVTPSHTHALKVCVLRL